MPHILFAVFIALFAIASRASPPDGKLPEQAADRRQSITLDLRAANHTDRTINLVIPPGWSLSPQVFQNARTLVDVEPGASHRPSAHVQIYVEPRLNHADALKQIRDFVAGVPAGGREFMAIGGWPAVQLAHIELQPQPSQGPPSQEPRVLKVEVYIAAGNDLVVVSGALPPNAPPGLVQKIRAIAESLGLDAVGNGGETEKELESLRSTPESAAPSPAMGAADETIVGLAEVEIGAESGANERIDANGRGELEVATSPNGLDVVVALQGRAFVSSNNGGASFPNSGTIGSGNGDPSIARAQSGNFYIAWIDTNCGSIYQTFNVGNLPAQTFGYDCTGISRSTDNGVSFQTNTVNPAAVCIGRAPSGGVDPAGACFPDQEHIAADPVNAGGGGGDQIYSTWRNFNAANQDAGLVCSQDNGVNWTAPITLGGNSFFPRITVGQDGFVYVAAEGGANYRIWKFSSCANGLALQAGFPVNVAGRTPYDCPFAGHDRCDQNPSSQTAVVDQTDPNHIYYAFAQDAGTAGSDSVVLVLDSLDGGLTWRPSVPANPGVNARRIMPWLCTTGGDAVVTWYEQRGAPDATDHYGAVVGLDDANALIAKDSFRVSEVPDNWCDSGWPCGTRFAGGDTNTDNAAEACPNQPQLAGFCGDNVANTADSGIRCDFSDEAAGPPTSICPRPGPSGNDEICLPGNGCPKYGDYNGNACAGGKLFAAWPSAASPPGVPPPSTNTNTGVLFDVVNLDAVDVPVITVPGSVRFGETCVGTTSYGTLLVCNTGSANLHVDEIGSSNPEFAVTRPSSGFPVTISPDFCFPFEVTYTPNGSGEDTAILTIPSDDPDRPTVTAAISGTASPPDINVAIANSGDFGEVCKGTQKDLDLTLFNQGKCNLTIASIASDNPLFVLPEDTQYPLVLSPDADFTLPVRFAPEICNDTPVEGTITINSDSPGEQSLEIDVSGVSPCPNLVIDPAGLTGLYAFPATVVDTEGTLGCFSERSVTLRNTGRCPLTISGIDASADDYAVTAPTQFPIELPPGEETLGVTVRFTPQDGGDPNYPDEVLGTLTVTSDDPDAAGTADLCGEGAVQSGMRILATEVTTGTPVPVGEVDSLLIKSQGKNTPSPISMRFTNLPVSMDTVCGNDVSWHVNVESLPTVETTGSNPKSSYTASAKEGNLQTSKSLNLGQCDFLEFQLQLTDSNGEQCLLKQKGESCELASECCSRKCTGLGGGKTCK